MGGAFYNFSISSREAGTAAQNVSQIYDLPIKWMKGVAIISPCLLHIRQRRALRSHDPAHGKPLRNKQHGEGSHLPSLANVNAADFVLDFSNFNLAQYLHP
jgi:hypothetical protein